MKKAGPVTAAVLIITVMLLAGCAGGATTPEPASPEASSTPPAASSPLPTFNTKAPVRIPATGVEIVRDVEYGRRGEVPLLLDLYVPQTPIVKPVPAVIWIHGGGWSGGDKYPATWIKSLAQRGFLGVSINYRTGGTAVFPAAVEDAKTAVRWMKAHASIYGADPEKIGVWGEYSGGHLALLVGCADESAGMEGGGWEHVFSRVQAVCAFYAPGNLVEWSKDKSMAPPEASLAEFMGGSFEEKSYAYMLASPVFYAGAGDPPLLLVHGEMDQTVPFRQSELMYRAYEEEGLEARLVKVEGAGHGFSMETNRLISPSLHEINQMVLEFFVEKLVGKQG